MKLIRTGLTSSVSMKGALICAALVFLGLTGCMSKPTGYSDFDRGTDFSGFKSFAFPPNRALLVTASSPANPALESILKEEVQRYMTRQGFTFSPSVKEADFVIGFVVGGVPTVTTTAFISSYVDVYVVGDTIPAVVVNQDSTEAGLVIDFYDRASEQKKWMGWTVEEITMSDQVDLRQTVRDAVAVILQHFPPTVTTADTTP